MGKIIGAIIVIGVVVWVVMMMNKDKGASTMREESEKIMSQTTQTSKENALGSSSMDSDVKEFAMDSYYDDKGAWFSVKEITVKKGDKVRVKVKNTKGNHDFTLDEYGIHQNTPLNQETVIEFTADKSGEFVYYCSMPGHRERGQWGKLIVKE